MNRYLQSIVAALIFVMPNNSFSQTRKEHAEISAPLGAPIPVMLPSPVGSIQAFTKTAKVIYTDSSGSSKLVPIEAVIVPSLRLYWVGVQGGREYFAFADKIVAVRSGSNDTVFFYPSTDRMASPDDEGAIQKTLDQKLANIGNEMLEYKSTAVRLEDSLGFFPFTKRPFAGGRPGPKIEKIIVNTSNFTIEFGGGKDDKVKASVTFSNEFKVTRAVLEGKQVFPKE